MPKPLSKCLLLLGTSWLALTIPCGLQAKQNGQAKSNQKSSTSTKESATQKAATPLPNIKVGDQAPDFTLPDQNGKKVSLRDFRGKKNVALAFYVFAFTGGWTQQMKNFQQNLGKLEASGTQVLGISLDSLFSNHEWAKQIGVTFPLLSDWGGDITRKYGVYEPKYKAARRVNYLIEKNGKVIEMQIDDEAIDPTKLVQVCERRKLKE